MNHNVPFHLRNKEMDCEKKPHVRRCAALGCRVNSRRFPGVKLFNFPRQQEGKLIRYNQWVMFSNNPKLKSGRSRSASLCQMHFADDQFKSARKDILHCNAVPTIPVKKLGNRPKKKSSHEIYKEKNKFVACNTNSFVVFNSDINLKKPTKNNFVNNNSPTDIKSLISSLEDNCTSSAVNSLSKLFGKPPDVSSHVPFDQWITYAKKQNIICDQVEYALCTAKRLDDFMGKSSSNNNNCDNSRDNSEFPENKDFGFVPEDSK